MTAATLLTVQTSRLLLIACPAQVARAVFTGKRHAESLLALRIHIDWPGDDIRGWLPIYAVQVENDPSVLGWGMWLVVHRADRMVIGDAGFKGKPDSSGTVDMGYGLVPAYRRQGYGFEAALAIRDWAFQQPGVKRITADCLPENTASARILEKIGMTRIGVSPAGLWLWERLKG